MPNIAPTRPEVALGANLDFATVRRSLESHRALVLEEESEAFGLIFVSLSRAGCPATLARRWAQVDPTIELIRPTLILFSTSLGEVTGPEIVTRLRDNPATQSAALIAIAPHESRKERRKLIQRGCDGYVWKPIDRLLFATELVARTPRLTQIGG